MRRRHAISPGFPDQYQDLGISSFKRHDSVCKLILSVHIPPLFQTKHTVRASSLATRGKHCIHPSTTDVQLCRVLYSAHIYVYQTTCTDHFGGGQHRVCVCVGQVHHGGSVPAACAIGQHRDMSTRRTSCRHAEQHLDDDRSAPRA